MERRKKDKRRKRLQELARDKEKMKDRKKQYWGLLQQLMCSLDTQISTENPTPTWPEKKEPNKCTERITFTIPGPYKAPKRENHFSNGSSYTK